MDKDLVDAYAERDFRQLHKRKTWSIRDQADQNGWERHDNEHARQFGYRYATCPICWPKEEYVNLDGEDS